MESKTNIRNTSRRIGGVVGRRIVRVNVGRDREKETNMQCW
jgi:hypothetical protein